MHQPAPRLAMSAASGASCSVQVVAHALAFMNSGQRHWRDARHSGCNDGGSKIAAVAVAAVLLVGEAIASEMPQL